LSRMEPWILRAATMRPGHPALGTLSYEELATRSRAAAAALRGRGVTIGARVAIALPAGAEFAVVLHGCLVAGAIAVPIDLRLTEDERGQRARGAILVDRPLEGALDSGAVSGGVELASVATVMHTSGTTAQPRPVELTYDNWLASALGSAVALGVDAEDRWLCPMPLTHVGGLSILLRSAIYATTAVVHDRFDTDAVGATLMDPAQRITLVSLVPTMLARLLDAGLRAPPTLRWALIGGGPLAPELLQRAQDADVPVAPTYGMTEACSQIATHGWPLPGVELRVDDDGEVLVQGATVAPGALATDGWLHTGDLGRVDPRGRLEIAGRKADTIISGGENVAPGEIEAVLLEHPAVADAGVHGRADPEWGEAVVASVVLRAGRMVDPAELRAFCATRLARFKVPKAFAFVPRLPRTESGKLLRRELG
jgi:o-succinylbenzoate---CoA ligase